MHSQRRVAGGQDPQGLAYTDSVRGADTGGVSTPAPAYGEQGPAARTLVALELELAALEPELRKS
jgi:hypothetical protein